MGKGANIHLEKVEEMKALS